MQLTAAILAAALVAGASAQPVKRNNGSVAIPLTRRVPFKGVMREKVTHEEISQQIAHLRAKLARNEANMQRHGGAKVVEKRGSGSVSLQDVNNQELWVGPMTFGGQTIQFDFDTGSSDTLCNSGAYSPGSSAQDTGSTFSDSYGDGTTASGEIYKDNMEIAGLSAPAYIGLASQSFVQSPDQGIAGMAFPSLASFSQQEPFFYSLQKAGALDYNGFQFELSTGSSSLTLGSIDNSVNFTPVTQQAYWSVSASVNGIDASGIVDSGTTLIVAPTSSAQQLFDSLGLQSSNQNGQLTATYDCNNPPSVTFTYGSAQVNLGSYTAYGTDSSGNCVLSVVGADVGSAGWIMGDPVFLAAGKVVFDVANSQVGFP